MPAVYPAEADLYAFLRGAGFEDTAGDDFAALNLANKVQSAIEAWEQATDWLPFLSPGVVQTRTYDPPGPPRRGNGFSSVRGGGTRVFLEAGLLSVPVVTVAGALYESGIQYAVQPSNAPAKGKPYTWIEFLVPVMARAGDVAVSGVWGYSLTCPAQAWTAILAQASVLCAPQLALFISRGLYKIEDVQFAGSGGMTPLTSERALWAEQFTQGVQDLRRPDYF